MEKLLSDYWRLCSEIMSMGGSERNVYHNWPTNMTETPQSCNVCELIYIHRMTDVLY